MKRLITLRRATKLDCRLVWEWRNEPGTRDASFNTDSIPYDDHRLWFEQSLTDPDTRVFIVRSTSDGEIGYVRFTFAERQAEISVSVDVGKRDKGYGTAAIRAGSDMVLATEAVERVIARVRRDNPRSMCAFTRAGFGVRGSRQIRGVDAYELVYQGRGNAARELENPNVLARSVLFRVDAGPDIGLGHLNRSISLATAVGHLGADCSFLTNKNSVTHDYVSRFGFDCYMLDAIDSWADSDLRQTIAMATTLGCKVVVVDSDYERANYLSRLRRAGLFVCAIDDTASNLFPCQLVINGDAHARELAYDLSSRDTIFLLGPEYSILRREFWERPTRVVRDVVQNILVTMGGADPYNLTPRILNLLDKLPGAFTVTAITGPFFDNMGEIEAAAQCGKHQVRLIRAPHTVCNLMLEADVAISAGGQTLYELACMGCPTVAVRTATNQDRQVKVMAEHGFLLDVGRADDSAVIGDVVDALPSLVNAPTRRGAMAVVGQRLVDGQGALRAARVILKHLGDIGRDRSAVRED